MATNTQVKTYLGISAATYDAFLEALIDEATVWIENEIGGRRIKADASDVTEYHDGGADKCKVFAKIYPITSITSISYKTGSNSSPVWTAYSVDDYDVDLTTGVLTFSSLPAGIQNIKLIYKAGFSSVPKDLELACIKLVAKEFDKRKSQGVLSESVGGGSVSWNENVDPSVLSIIRKYRRF